MKTIALVLFFLIFQCFSSIGQQIDSVNIPKGVVYKYCSPDIVEKAKALILKDLSDPTSYSLNGGAMFVGPVLWTRYKKITSMESIAGGDVTINFNKEKLSAKMTQTEEGFKKVWDQVRKEIIIDQLKLRKATSGELQYYWAVISFDIAEPLLIAESGQHRFILNISPKELKLIWLDEVPVSVK